MAVITAIVFLCIGLQRASSWGPQPRLADLGTP